MAILEQSDHELQQGTLSFLLDSLFCDEEVEVESFGEEISDKDYNFIINSRNERSPFLDFLEEDLLWEDEELDSLFSREKQAIPFFLENGEKMESFYCLNVVDREKAVNWMIKVTIQFGFSALTAVLSINFFDRFVSSVKFGEDEPWMVQLAAVTCLSVAAKVEETQVPLLLDIQVGDSNYVFEAKTIQNMELLVMSTLQWRMNPVTPLSFLDHITRRLGLKSDLHWEFFKKSESLILSVVSDWKFIGSLPSVLATATMLHVIHQIDPSNAIEYQNQLLGVLRITKEEINECYELIGNLSNTCYINGNNSHKRKYEQEKVQIPRSPSGVIDSEDCFSSEGPSVSSSPEPFLFLKNKIAEEKMVQMSSLHSLSMSSFNSLS